MNTKFKLPSARFVVEDLRRCRSEARLQRKNLGYVPLVTQVKLEQALVRAETWLTIRTARDSARGVIDIVL